jgi:hypothetical protein
MVQTIHAQYEKHDGLRSRFGSPVNCVVIRRRREINSLRVLCWHAPGRDDGDCPAIPVLPSLTAAVHVFFQTATGVAVEAIALHWYHSGEMSIFCVASIPFLCQYS